ncbi:MAG: hypothetical protein KDH97_25265, partial [Calditrichaeota bacterium]|nr:hypothetical protein [Calditrichota bacterium]
MKDEECGVRSAECDLPRIDGMFTDFLVTNLRFCSRTIMVFEYLIGTFNLKPACYIPPAPLRRG